MRLQTDHAYSLALTALFLALRRRQLSKPEQAMIQTVTRSRSARVDARNLGEPECGTELAGRQGVGEMVRAEREPLGFKVEWIDSKPLEVRAHRRSHPGRGKKLLLIGHLDTGSKRTPVPRWTRRQRWRRAGAADNKGASR